MSSSNPEHPYYERYNPDKMYEYDNEKTSDNDKTSGIMKEFENGNGAIHIDKLGDTTYKVIEMVENRRLKREE